jgi:hypothetical protein
MFDMFPRDGESEDDYVNRLKSYGMNIHKLGEGEFFGEMKSPMGVPKPADPRKQIDETRKESARERDDCAQQKKGPEFTAERSAHTYGDALVKKFLDARDQALGDYLTIGGGKTPTVSKTVSSMSPDAKITVGTAMPRSFILDGAKEIVYGARQHMYGHAAVNFQRTADLWRGVFGQEVTNLQVGAAMLQLKLARLGNLIEREATGGPPATFAEIEDTMKDIAGYAEATMRSLFELPDGTRFDQQGTMIPAGKTK